MFWLNSSQLIKTKIEAVRMQNRSEPNCIVCANELTDEDRFEGLCNTCAKKEGILYEHHIEY
ncbi:hypothetical protein DNHGIG_25520 [Collibacillus ludicampi]|uniref:Inhibitor of sigma-G Gin n=1 Tax=Collibacillus ludicampi TaxID=2771369 RepID=A0AAV4LGU2_9BACL|nr:hypothetical protein DNHGIG_25520 [Collibacillus ludicampi]